MVSIESHDFKTRASVDLRPQSPTFARPFRWDSFMSLE
jgi:hypothetical protein